MRTSRILLDNGACAYHCVSRVVGRGHLFTDQHKEKIQDIILNSAGLLGAHLINFVVMSNHVHILVQIPPKNDLQPLAPKSLLGFVGQLYSPEYLTDLKQEFDRAARSDNPESARLATERILDRYERRRADLSEFMKEVKQRITHYINRQYNRIGTLWEGRFKSPIIENTAQSLLAVSTYIDLNPVRAGIVDRPEKYRWCGYATALAGDRQMRKGLRSIYASAQGTRKLPRWSAIHDEYRQYLFEKGIDQLADPATGAGRRRGISAEQVEREIERRGKLPLHEVICHRVRYFTDGAVIGSAGFVNQVFDQKRHQLVSAKSRRRTGARPMRGAHWGGLTTLRDLRVNVIGHPS